MYRVNKHLVLTLWSYIPVISALGRWRQNWEFKVSLHGETKVCRLLCLMSPHAVTQHSFLFGLTMVIMAHREERKVDNFIKHSPRETSGAMSGFPQPNYR